MQKVSINLYVYSNILKITAIISINKTKGMDFRKIDVENCNMVYEVDLQTGYAA